MFDYSLLRLRNVIYTNLIKMTEIAQGDIILWFELDLNDIRF